MTRARPMTLPHWYSPSTTPAGPHRTCSSRSRIHLTASPGEDTSALPIRQSRRPFSCGAVCAPGAAPRAGRAYHPVDAAFPPLLPLTGETRQLNIAAGRLHCSAHGNGKRRQRTPAACWRRPLPTRPYAFKNSHARQPLDRPMPIPSAGNVPTRQPRRSSPTKNDDAATGGMPPLCPFRLLPADKPTRAMPPLSGRDADNLSMSGVRTSSRE